MGRPCGRGEWFFLLNLWQTITKCMYTCTCVSAFDFPKGVEVCVEYTTSFTEPQSEVSRLLQVQNHQVYTCIYIYMYIHSGCSAAWALQLL